MHLAKVVSKEIWLPQTPKRPTSTQQLTYKSNKKNRIRFFNYYKMKGIYRPSPIARAPRQTTKPVKTS